MQEDNNSWDKLPEDAEADGDEFDPTKYRVPTPIPPRIETYAPRPSREIKATREPPPLPGGTNVPPPPKASRAPRGSRAAPPRTTNAPEMDRDSIRQFLLTTPLIDDPKIAKGAADRAEVRRFAAGAVVLAPGRPADGMGFLVRGRATVATVEATSGKRTIVQTLKPGDHFGEVSALTGTAQPYEIKAAEPCLVVLLNAETFDLLLNRVPGFAQLLAKRLAMRLVQLGVKALRGASSGSHDDLPQAVPVNTGKQLEEGAIPFAEVADYKPSRDVLAMLPQRMIMQHRVIPLKLTSTKLTVGMVTPRNAAAVGEVRRYLHRVELDVVAIAQDDFAQAVVQFRLEGNALAQQRQDIISPETLQFDIIDSEREAEKAVRVIGDEVVRAVNKIIAMGIQREASDVHVEPTQAGVQVRFRVNGHLEAMKDYLPLSFAPGISTRMKILAGLDITERRMPQDGRIGITVGRREVDMRISTIPASRGEKIVLRIFEQSGMSRPLERVFVDKGVLDAVRQALARHSGAVLIAGGTGSGKSTTLYSTLAERKRNMPDSNILMVEDPIEYRLQDITQIQVNPAVNLGFAEVLRAMLRQDPDVIAIGETRDASTAATALEAAMTGHLLLTTVHATDVMSAIQRLEGLGCGRELMAQSISLIIGQRLARRLCPECSTTELPAPLLQASLEAKGLLDKGARLKLPRAVGCEQCNHTGYLGRVPVVESLRMDESVRDALLAGRPLADVERCGKETNAFLSYRRYTATLMARSLISAVDALMVVAG